MAEFQRYLLKYVPTQWDASPVHRHSAPFAALMTPWLELIWHFILCPPLPSVTGPHATLWSFSTRVIVNYHFQFVKCIFLRIAKSMLKNCKINEYRLLLYRKTVNIHRFLNAPSFFLHFLSRALLPAAVALCEAKTTISCTFLLTRTQNIAPGTCVPGAIWVGVSPRLRRRHRRGGQGWRQTRWAQRPRRRRESGRVTS